MLDDSSMPTEDHASEIENADRDDSLENTRKESVEQERAVAYRGERSDPVFGYLVAIALSIGTVQLMPDLRYTLSWSAMAGFGVLAWLLGRSARIGQEKPENLAWGIVFGLILGAPLLAVGGSLLTTAVQRLFPMMGVGTLLAYLVFVMPLAETLFFRGVLQENRPFWLIALLASAWSMLLFFPVLNVLAYPAVAGVIAVALLMMNLTYSYIRDRNGLAAAWLCQIVCNVVLLVLPFLS